VVAFLLFKYFSLVSIEVQVVVAILVFIGSVELSKLAKKSLFCLLLYEGMKVIFIAMIVVIVLILIGNWLEEISVPIGPQFRVGP